MEIQEALNLELKKNFDLRLETNKNKQTKETEKENSTYSEKKPKRNFYNFNKDPFLERNL